MTDRRAELLAWAATLQPTDELPDDMNPIWLREALQAALTSPLDREAVARIIAGFGPRRPDQIWGPATQAHWANALEKAGRILALLPAHPVERTAPFSRPTDPSDEQWAEWVPPAPVEPQPVQEGVECSQSPFGRHQVDTSMESGPNNCFFCDLPMGKR